MIAALHIAQNHTIKFSIPSNNYGTNKNCIISLHSLNLLQKKNCGIAETHTTFQMINPNNYVKTIPGYNWAHSDGGQSGAMPQCK